jgi:hypothetical protein
LAFIRFERGAKREQVEDEENVERREREGKQQKEKGRRT